MSFYVLTKTSVESAFRKKITAKQIMDFLETHSHLHAQYAK